jgi:putative PIN family toxin of toxin-antitoxin system
VRVVLDPSVLVAAIRGQAGASKTLIAAALGSKIPFLISTPLVLEYEAVLKLREHSQASRLTVEAVGEMLDMVCASGIPVQMTQGGRPKLRDPDDEMVLGTAINGPAEAIVTFNRADFSGVLEEFGIDVLAPIDVVQKMGIK